MPVIKFDTLDAVPEGLRDIATETEDEKVEIDVVAKIKLDEFRDNNITLSQERDELTTKVTSLTALVGEDQEEFVTSLEALKKTAQRVQDGELVENTSLEDAVSQRITEMKAAYEEQQRQAASETKAWKEKAESSDIKFKRSIIDREVTNAILSDKSGARSEALHDILSRSYDVFSVQDNGSLVAKNGEVTIYGADGATPMSPIEWLGKLKDDAPYFFKSSGGGGSEGGEKHMGDMSAADFAKLPARERLSRVNEQTARNQ